MRERSCARLQLTLVFPFHSESFDGNAIILALTILSCLFHRYSHTHSNLKHFNNKEIREAVLSKEESFDGNANTGTDNSLLFVTQILTKAIQIVNDNCTVNTPRSPPLLKCYVKMT